MKLLPLLLTLALLAGCASAPRTAPRLFVLTIFTVRADGLILPLSQSTIRDPRHEPDGSLCFEQAETGKYECAKLVAYDILEQTSE